jgi:hypothetical protein
MKKELRGMVIGIGLTLGALALAQSVQRTLNVLVNGQPNADKAIVVNNTSYVPARVLRNFGVTVTAQGNNLLLNGSGGTGGTVSSSPAASAPVSSNPAPSNSGAAGTNQLAGNQGRLNVAYTMGKQAPLNFTLNAAEYRLEPISLGGEVYSVDGTQKMLILRFTVQNPTQAERDLSWGSFKITAIDSRDVNHEFKSYFVREGETDRYNTSLKASQRVNLVAGVIVPSNANITKLLLERNGETAPVVRYDLRNQIKPLAAPYSTDGFTALPEIAAQTGTNYLTQSFAMRVESFAFTNETLDGKTPDEGKRFITATVTVKNLRQTQEADVGWSTLKAAITDADGVRIENNNYIVRASSGQRFDTTLKPNAEARYRFFLEVDQSQSLKQFSLKEGDDGRVFTYDISSLR